MDDWIENNSTVIITADTNVTVYDEEWDSTLLTSTAVTTTTFLVPVNNNDNSSFGEGGSTVPTFTPPPEAMMSEWTGPQLTLLLLPTVSIMVSIVFGNLLVIAAILSQRNLRTPPNMYILSLALTDILVGIFILPFNVYDMIHGWKSGDGWSVLCKVWLTADVTLCSSSILHISAIAVDRFRSINEGVAYAQSRSIGSVLGICAGLWFLGLWIASPPVLGWNDWKKGQVECRLTTELGYIIHSATGAFFIPAFVMVVLYSRIFCLLSAKFRERAKMKCLSTTTQSTIEYNTCSSDGLDDDDTEKSDDKKEGRSGSKRRSFNIFKNLGSGKARFQKDASESAVQVKVKTVLRNQPSEQISTILATKVKYSLKKERKAAKTLGILIGAFLLAWTPFTLTYLFMGILGGPENVNATFFQIVTWLGYVNSAVNPIIYNAYSQEFKKGFRKLVVFW